MASIGEVKFNTYGTLWGHRLVRVRVMSERMLSNYIVNMYN